MKFLLAFNKKVSEKISKQSSENLFIWLFTTSNKIGARTQENKLKRFFFAKEEITKRLYSNQIEFSLIKKLEKKYKVKLHISPIS